MLVEPKNHDDNERKKQESAEAGSYSARRKGSKRASTNSEGLGKKVAKTALKGAVNAALPGAGDKVASALDNKSSNKQGGPKQALPGMTNPLLQNPFHNLMQKGGQPVNLAPKQAPLPLPKPNPLPQGKQTSSTRPSILEEEREDEVLEEGEEEERVSSQTSFFSRNKKKQSKGISGDAFGDFKTFIKKSLPVLIPIAAIAASLILFSCVILVNIDNFGPMLGINTKVGGETGGEEYEAMDSEENAFYERVKVIHDEYASNGVSFDAEIIGAVYFILQTHNTELTFFDMDDSAIRTIVEAMFDSSDDETKLYKKEVFTQNLIDQIFPLFLPKVPQNQYSDIAEEVFEYIEDYKDLIGANKKNNNGICIEGTLQASQLASMSPQDYIKTLGPIAQRDYSRTGVFASVTLAQSILESGWAKSTLSLKYNNMFGIKCSSNWTGRCINMTTKEEYTTGNITTIQDAFRVYDSVDESLNDHSKFLLENPRYPAAGVFSARDAREQIAAIKRAGYATDSSYVPSVLAVMDSYNLQEWDVTVNTNTSDDDCLGASNAGFDIRTVAPTASDVYFNLKNSNRGQCVWYAQARAIEAAQNLASKGLITQVQANNVQNALLNIYGDAGMWYLKAVTSGIFNGSTDIKQVKAGSIIVWAKSGGYGHVAFVENVDTTNNTITITEGWATNTTSCPNNWGCVNFKSNVMSLDDYYSSFGPRYSGKYRFLGYVYALEPKVG